MLQRFDAIEGLDLVDFGDFRAWMLVNDLLYDGAVDPHCKGFSITDHYKQFENGAFPRCRVDRQTSPDGIRTREFGYFVLRNFIEQRIPFNIIDIGAFIGDQSLRYASFLRTIGERRAKVFAIDPSLSGDLIPYNSRLNRLDDLITFYPVAIGPVNGLVPFTFSQGNTDSGRISAPEKSREQTGRKINSSVVECFRLDDALRTGKIEHCLLKTDLEGYDSVVIRQIEDHLKRTYTVLVWECSVEDNDSIELAAEMLERYAILDVGYFPNMHCLNQHFSRDTIYRDVMKAPYVYTDIMAIPKNLPGFDNLMSIAQRAVPSAPTYHLSWS